MSKKNEVIRLKTDVLLSSSFQYKKRFISLIKHLIYQIYQEFDQYLNLVIINIMAEERHDFGIVMNRKAKWVIWQHWDFIKVCRKLK